MSTDISVKVRYIQLNVYTSERPLQDHFHFQIQIRLICGNLHYFIHTSKTCICRLYCMPLFKKEHVGNLQVLHRYLVYSFCNYLCIHTCMGFWLERILVNAQIEYDKFDLQKKKKFCISCHTNNQSESVLELELELDYLHTKLNLSN